MKRYLAILLVLAMLGSLGACASKESSNPGTAGEGSEKEEPTTQTETGEQGEQEEQGQEAQGQEEQLHIVYVSPLLANVVWDTAKQGFEQACKELNIRGDWVGPTNISPEDMAKLIDTAVAEHADAIITQGLVAAAPVQAAIDAGIPVLVVDSDIPDAERFAYLGKDVTVQAQALRTEVEKKLSQDTPIKFAIQAASWSYEIAHDQLQAIEEAFADWPGGFELVAQSESNSDKMTATNEWQKVLTAYPEINVCMSIAGEAAPACAAVAKEMGIRDRLLIYGVDDIDETLDMIREGDIDGTAAVSFWNYGYQAAYWLYQHITEGKAPANVINDAGTVMVTMDNIDTYGDAMREKVDLE